MEPREIIKNDWLFTTDHSLDDNNKKLKKAIENILEELDSKNKTIELMSHHIYALSKTLKFSAVGNSKQIIKEFEKMAKEDKE